MQTCCPKKCFLKIDIENQKKIHDGFWKCSDYQAGNILISQMLERKDSAHYKRIQWNFYCRIKGHDIVVCKKFICNVFGVGKKRIETIQKKR